MTNRSKNQTAPDRARNGRFEKGHQKRGGRKPGTPNKITIMLKDASILAADQVGRDGKGKDRLVGYLRECARNRPAEYARLLAAVLKAQSRREAARRDI
jgi:hypothetical protein